MLMDTSRPGSLDCSLRAFCLQPECLAATSACVPCLPAVLLPNDAFVMPVMIRFCRVLLMDFYQDALVFLSSAALHITDDPAGPADPAP